MNLYCVHIMNTDSIIYKTIILYFCCHYLGIINHENGFHSIELDSHNYINIKHF